MVEVKEEISREEKRKPGRRKKEERDQGNRGRGEENKTNPKREEGISEEGEEVEDIYHDAVEEAEKGENTETREEKEGGGADKGRKREEKQEAGENIQQCEMGYIRLTKPKLKETQENLVWLRLVKEGTEVKIGKEEDQSSWANLEGR